MESPQKVASARLPGRVIIAVIACIVLLIFSAELVWRHHAQRLAVRACFQNVGQLKEGSRVLIAGVKVGYVTRLSTHPDNPSCAVEAEMVLNTAYQFTIPTDSTISLIKAKSGQTEASIHIEDASGPPLAQGAMLKSQP